MSAAELAHPDRPLNRQGRPRKWGDHCWECRREVQMQWMRQGLCAACYQRHRRAGTIATNYVDPVPAREHLAEVHAAGVSYRWIAQQAGTNTVNLNNVAQGRRTRISGELADKILSVPVPETDEAALRRRALQVSGMKGIYVGVQRRYQQDRARRGVAYHKRDRLRHSLKAQYLAEREEFLAWLYEGMPAKVVEPKRAPQPVQRVINWELIACAECEHRPCACGRADDHDLWITLLADHDDPASLNLRRAVAA